MACSAGRALGKWRMHSGQRASEPKKNESVVCSAADALTRVEREIAFRALSFGESCKKVLCMWF